MADSSSRSGERYATPAILEYINRIHVAHDAGLARAFSVPDGIPAIQVSPSDGKLVELLLRLARAAKVVEVGTLIGYSAITMARALPPNGRVRTIELESRHADFAERWIEKSDVAGKIEVFRGAALEVLPRFEDDSADAAFLDADKENYPRYLEECMRIVRSGGLIMADNAFAFGELFEARPREGVAAMRRFNDVIAKRRGLHAIIVPFGDGLWVARKE